MGVLTVRKFPEEAKQALRVRAAEHGRSVEAEVRAILLDALAGDAPAPPIDFVWLDKTIEFGKALEGESLALPERKGLAPALDVTAW